MRIIGDILLRQGLLSQAQLDQALALQQRSNARLGDIVVAQGMVNYLTLYRALAEHWDLPFIDLLHSPPDEHLLSPDDTQAYLLWRAIPWRRQDGRIIVAMAEQSDGALAWVAQRFGGTAQIAITSPLDIRKTVERVFGVAFEEESRLALWQENPAASARETVSAHTRRLLLGVTAALIALAVWQPVVSAMALIAFCCMSYCATMLIKALIFAEGTKRAPAVDWAPRLAALDEKTLPVYTVLIPMYREARSLPGMVEAMRGMDYPAEKLDIKLVLEDDDAQTIDAAQQLKLHHQFEIIRVPAGTLRTKPKACNYALRFARGEYVTIFDADDRPEPLQLKKAVAVFDDSPPDVACLQARLNYYNAEANLLTRFFSLEYTILFEVLLYGLERLGIPLPLGGTSNHMALARLRELGAWDPFNVTEDADLGTRLAACGFRTVMLDSDTLEEAPHTVPAWIRQRSRWMKGYMQTWLVHMRSPRTLYRSLGLRSFCGFQFFVGFSTFTFLSGPLVWLLALAWWAFPPALPASWLPGWLLWLTVVNLVLNFTTHWYMMVYCVTRRSRATPENKAAAIFYPFYLVLHSVASYKALWQLIVKPHFWEKTAHGLAPTFERKAMQEIAQGISQGISLTAAH